MARRLRRGDQVQVMSGKYRGQQGKILTIVTHSDPNRERVRIEGVAVVKRHLGPNKDRKVPEGGIVERLGSIHVSNVLPLDPKSGRPTKVAFRVERDAAGGSTRKVRVARRSGEPLGLGRPI